VPSARTGGAAAIVNSAALKSDRNI
jgi:hypothetical protein